MTQLSGIMRERYKTKARTIQLVSLCMRGPFEIKAITDIINSYQNIGIFTTCICGAQRLALVEADTGYVYQFIADDLSYFEHASMVDALREKSHNKYAGWDYWFDSCIDSYLSAYHDANEMKLIKELVAYRY